MLKEKSKLYKKKDKEVLDKLRDFEFHELKNTGMKWKSGGFSEAKIVDFDEEYFEIMLKYGCQSDCENVVYTEYFKMDRKTLKITERD